MVSSTAREAARSIHYPDPEHADAEIILNNAVAWRRYSDGREEALSEAEEEASYARLHSELEAGAPRSA